MTKWLKLNYSYEKLGDPLLIPLVKAVDMYNHPLAVKIFQTFTATAGEPIKVHMLRKVHEIDERALKHSQPPSYHRSRIAYAMYYMYVW